MSPRHAGYRRKMDECPIFKSASKSRSPDRGGHGRHGAGLCRGKIGRILGAPLNVGLSLWRTFACLGPPFDENAAGKLKIRTIARGAKTKGALRRRSPPPLTSVSRNSSFSTRVPDTVFFYSRTGPESLYVSGSTRRCPSPCGFPDSRALWPPQERARCQRARWRAFEGGSQGAGRRALNTRKNGAPYHISDRAGSKPLRVCS